MTGIVGARSVFNKMGAFPGSCGGDCSCPASSRRRCYRGNRCDEFLGTTRTVCRRLLSMHLLRVLLRRVLAILGEREIEAMVA